MADNHSPQPRDTAAAYTGLIGGAILIAAIILTIVFLTNKKFEGHSKAPGAAHAVATQEALPRA